MGYPHLTQVAPRCSMGASGGLPTESDRVRGSILHRGGVPGLPFSDALAGRFLLPPVRPRQGVACPQGLVRVRRLRPTDFGDSGHRLSGLSQTVDALVSRHLVRHVAENRHQRLGVTARAWIGQLPDGLDLATQAAPGYGAARAGAAAGSGGSRRNVSGRGGRGRSRPSNRTQGIDCHRCGALVHESELARNEPDSQVHHLARAYDDGLPSSAIRLRM